MLAEKPIANNKKEQKKSIKCVVWDLDNTLWQGVLLEDESVTLTEGIREIIVELDKRGILQSVASKNEFNTAMKKLQQLGLDEYFLYPQISWNSKSSSIQAIAKALNIGYSQVRSRIQNGRRNLRICMESSSS